VTPHPVAFSFAGETAGFFDFSMHLSHSPELVNYILLTMAENKTEILKNICYTELVYKRINKKLNSTLSKGEIERMLFSIIDKTDVKDFEKRGKNFYITSVEHTIRITVNSHTYRVITVDKSINSEKQSPKAVN